MKMRSHRFTTLIAFLGLIAFSNVSLAKDDIGNKFDKIGYIL